MTGERPDPWVLVMGMHRSGTSALTGALGATGLQLYRPDDRVEWAESNPEHWESLSLTLYDEDLLVRFDGSWDAPPTLPSGWERGSEVPAVADATRVIESAYPESGPSLWKDPRLCLLLPFWRNVLAPPLAAVFVWRSPIAVARSLLHRDQLPLPDGLALWERYNRAGLEALDGVETYVLELRVDRRATRRNASANCSTGSVRSTSSRAPHWSGIRCRLRRRSPRSFVTTQGARTTDPDPTCLPEQRALAEYLAASAGGHRPFTPKLPGPRVAVDDLAAATSPKAERTQSRARRRARVAPADPPRSRREAGDRPTRPCSDPLVDELAGHRAAPRAQRVDRQVAPAFLGVIVIQPGSLSRPQCQWTTENAPGGLDRVTDAEVAAGSVPQTSRDHRRSVADRSFRSRKSARPISLATLRG